MVDRSSFISDVFVALCAHEATKIQSGELEVMNFCKHDFMHKARNRNGIKDKKLIEKIPITHTIICIRNGTSHADSPSAMIIPGFWYIDNVPWYFTVLKVPLPPPPPQDETLSYDIVQK